MRRLIMFTTTVALSTAGGAAQAAGTSAATPPRERAQPATVQAAAAAKSAAEGEAARLLASLPVPAGSTGLGGEPPEAGGALAPPPARAVAVDLVTGTGWWSVPGGPRAAIEYVHDHLSELSPFSRSVFPVTVRPGTLSARVRLIEGAGSVGERWLVLTAVALPSGASALRADSQVVWLRPRDVLPTRARVVRVTVAPRAGPRRSFVLRSRGRVRATFAVLNSLPVERPSFLVRDCRVPRGTVTLAFLSSARARGPLATATTSIGGCGEVSLTIRGKPPQPTLQDLKGDLPARLERALRRRLLRSGR